MQSQAERWRIYFNRFKVAAKRQVYESYGIAFTMGLSE